MENEEKDKLEGLVTLLRKLYAIPLQGQAYKLTKGVPFGSGVWLTGYTKPVTAERVLRQLNMTEDEVPDKYVRRIKGKRYLCLPPVQQAQEDTETL